MLLLLPLLLLSPVLAQTEDPAITNTSPPDIPTSTNEPGGPTSPLVLPTWPDGIPPDWTIFTDDYPWPTETDTFPWPTFDATDLPLVTDEWNPRTDEVPGYEGTGAEPTALPAEPWTDWEGWMSANGGEDATVYWAGGVEDSGGATMGGGGESVTLERGTGTGSARGVVETLATNGAGRGYGGEWGAVGGLVVCWVMHWA